MPGQPRSPGAACPYLWEGITAQARIGAPSGWHSGMLWQTTRQSPSLTTQVRRAPIGLHSV